MKDETKIEEDWSMNHTIDLKMNITRHIDHKKYGIEKKYKEKILKRMTGTFIHELTHVACYLCLDIKNEISMELFSCLPYQLEDREASRLFLEAVEKDLAAHEKAGTYFYTICKQIEDNYKGNPKRIISEYIAYAVQYLAVDSKETDPPLTHVTKFIVDHWLPKIACDEDQELVRELQRQSSKHRF